MPVAFGSAQDSTFTGGSSHSYGIPAHNSGDGLILVVASTRSVTPATAINTPSGWTAVPADGEAGNFSAVRLSAFVKSGNGSESSVAVSLDGNPSFGSCGTVITAPGAKLTDLIDVVGSIITQESGVDITSPSVTTTEADTLIVQAYCFDDDLSSEADADSDAGFAGTMRGYGEIATPGNGLAFGVSTRTQASIGASGTCDWSTNGDSDAGVAITFAVRSEPAGPNVTDVGGDEEFDDKDTGVVITGSGFEASQGTGKVEIGDNADYATANKVEQTVTGWGDTSITITADLGAQSPGAKWLFVTNDSAERNDPGFAVTLHRANAFTLALSTHFVDGAATTAQLTAPAAKTTADFDPSTIHENQNPADSVDITADDYTEPEFNLAATVNAREVPYNFRITDNGTPLDSYGVTIQGTIGTAASTGTADGAGTATGEGGAEAGGDGTADGAGAATGDGGAEITGDGAADGAGAVTGSGAAELGGDGSADGQASVSGEGGAEAGGDGTGDGQAVVSGEGAAETTGDGTADGQATVSGDGGAEVTGDGTADGQASVSGEGRAEVSGDGAADGQADVSGEGGAEAAATGTAAGTSTADGVPGSDDPTGSSAGSGDATGEGGAEITGDGTADGQAGVTGEGAAEAETSGTADGAGAATGEGRAEISTDGTADGQASVTGEGRAEIPGDGTADGQAVVSGEGRVERGGDGTADGQATVSGEGGAELGGDGSVDGQAVVSGEGAAEAGATGQADGAADAIGEGRAEAETTGTASGAATATGVGDFDSPFEGTIGELTATSAAVHALASSISAVNLVAAASARVNVVDPSSQAAFALNAANDRVTILTATAERVIQP